MSIITIQIDNGQPIKSVSVEFYNNGDIKDISSTPINNKTYGSTIGSATITDSTVGHTIGSNFNPMSRVNEDEYLTKSENLITDEPITPPAPVPDTSNREVKVATTMNEGV